MTEAITNLSRKEGRKEGGREKKNAGKINF
jgi:hypothetical protein